MPSAHTKRRNRIQGKKCCLKKILLKKAKSLAEKSNLKVNIKIYDEEAEVLQEFKSSPEFNSEWVAAYKKDNHDKKVDYGSLVIRTRKELPRKNFVEETTLDNVIQNYSWCKLANNKQQVS